MHLQKLINMALAIRTTPILTGDDAVRFEATIEENSKHRIVVPDYNEKKEAFDKIIAKSKE